MIRKMFLIAILLAVPMSLSKADAQANSLPRPMPIVSTIPEPRDQPYFGTIHLDVDVSDTSQGIFNVHEIVPARPGAMTLRYPHWLPGNHGPTGEVDKLAGLVIRADGKILPWTRDPVDLFAFHIDVPPGASEITADFQYLGAIGPAPGLVVMTPEIINLQWTSLLLYPAGYYVRDIPMNATVHYPTGWASATALCGTIRGSTASYSTLPMDVFVDSPAFAGKFARKEVLRPNVTLNMFADSQEDLDAATKAMIDANGRLIDQADRLFGTRHYDHYDFLLAVSDRLSGIGLEHHRSSQDGVSADYFRTWDKQSYQRILLPHEYTHSWNGKFRRPADLWTPDYAMPMRDSLLWVYEGQTEFWGTVLAARSGLINRDEALGALADAAAAFTEGRPGRAWRSLQDTTNQPAFARQKPLAWGTWQRNADYYDEGMLLWLAVDQVIRKRSGGRRSLDDFARRFFGMRPGDFGELTYTFDDVVDALNAVQPYDWRPYLRSWLDGTDSAHLLEGIDLGGYRLVWRDEPNIFDKNTEDTSLDFTWSLGLSTSGDGKIDGVVWGSPAFKAKLAPGVTITAVNGMAFSGDRLVAAVKAAKSSAAPVTLLIKNGDAFTSVTVDYHGGLRYPALEKVAREKAGIDVMLKAL